MFALLSFLRQLGLTIVRPYRRPLAWFYAVVTLVSTIFPKGSEKMWTAIVPSYLLSPWFLVWVLLLVVGSLVVHAWKTWRLDQPRVVVRLANRVGDGVDSDGMTYFAVELVNEGLTPVNDCSLRIAACTEPASGQDCVLENLMVPGRVRIAPDHHHLQNGELSVSLRPGDRAYAKVLKHFNPHGGLILVTRSGDCVIFSPSTHIDVEAVYADGPKAQLRLYTYLDSNGIMHCKESTRS